MLNQKLYALGENTYDTKEAIFNSIVSTLIDCNEFCHRNKTSAYGTTEEKFEQAINEKICVGADIDGLEEYYTLYEVHINLVPKEIITNTTSQTISIHSRIAKID